MRKYLIVCVLSAPLVVSGVNASQSSLTTTDSEKKSRRISPKVRGAMSEPINMQAKSGNSVSTLVASAPIAISASAELIRKKKKQQEKQQKSVSSEDFNDIFAEEQPQKTSPQNRAEQSVQSKSSSSPLRYWDIGRLGQSYSPSPSDYSQK